MAARSALHQLTHHPLLIHRSLTTHAGAHLNKDRVSRGFSLRFGEFERIATNADLTSIIRKGIKYLGELSAYVKFNFISFAVFHCGYRLSMHDSEDEAKALEYVMGSDFAHHRWHIAAV